MPQFEGGAGDRIDYKPGGEVFSDLASKGNEREFDKYINIDDTGGLHESVPLSDLDADYDGYENSIVIHKKGKRINLEENGKMPRKKILMKNEGKVTPTIQPIAEALEKVELETPLPSVEAIKGGDVLTQEQEEFVAIFPEISDAGEEKLIPFDLYKKIMALKDNNLLREAMKSLDADTIVHLDNSDTPKTTDLQTLRDAESTQQSRNTESEKESKVDHALDYSISLWGSSSSSKDDSIFTEASTNSLAQETAAHTDHEAQQNNPHQEQNTHRSNHKQRQEQQHNQVLEKEQKQGQPHIDQEEPHETSQEISRLEKLLSIANTKDELIAVIAKSDSLQEGMHGSQQIYSKDDLIALIEAVWSGEVGIDHLPRTDGFRENVARTHEYERKHDPRIAKQKTAEELDSDTNTVMNFENSVGLTKNKQTYGINKRDNSLVYNYDKYPRTEANSKKNSSILGKIWKKLTGKK